MLDFRMYTFLEVCKTLNYTKAAKNLNITQPGVSQHIRYLEKHYGHPLVQVKNKTVSITPYGEKLWQMASAMAHDEVHLQQEFKELEMGSRELNLGVTMTIGEFVIAKPLACYLETHPEVTAHIKVDNTKSLLQLLEEDLLDFAIVEGYFSKQQYENRRYSLEPFVAICGKKYYQEQLQGGVQTLEQLFTCPLIARESGSGTREVLEKALEERNFSIQNFGKRMEINSIHVIKTLVQENCGITFLYRAAAWEELKKGTLVEIPIQDFQVSHDFTFIWKKGSIYAHYYEEMYHILR